MSSTWALSADEQERLIRKQISDISVSLTNNSTITSNHSSASGNDNKNESVASGSSEGSESVPLSEHSLWQKKLRKTLVQTTQDLEIQRKDPRSPLYHVKTFEELHLKPELLQGLYDMGYNAPSKVQETTLPAILADPPVNFIAQSQSGTGKTAAFVVAMLSRVDVTKRYPQAMCLSPTYELAVQTGEVAFRMSKFMSEIQMAFAVRGEEVKGKISEHIIIGTPGKLLDWSTKHKLFDLSRITVFVLDEADVMISTQGHYEQVHRIRKFLHPRCQMLLFSATYDKEVIEFAESIIKDPLILRLRREDESLDNIKQYYVKCKSEADKYRAISNIYGVISIGQAIIFCQTRRAAKWLAEEMTKDGHSVAMLSAELTVEDRLKVLDGFRDMQQKVLITTNVLSRGIDIETVNIVVNFHMPVDVNHKADCETYLHRIGRTGRFGKSGVAVNLIQHSGEMEILKTIEKHFGKTIHPLNIDSVEDIESIQDD